MALLSVYRGSLSLAEGSFLIFRSAAASAARNMQSMSPNRGITRRGLLATGGVAGAAVAAGIKPWAAHAQAATAGDTPPYLIRSSYQSLSTQSFGTSLRGATSDLTLQSVADLPAAATDKSLAGSEDAFALSFSASTPLQPEIHTFSHPDLGVFDLFIAPVEGRGTYEVVVNRSVNAPKHYPKPPASNSNATSNGTPPAAAAPNPAPGAAPKAHIRRLRARRVGRAVVAEVTFNGNVDLKWASAWLTHKGRVVAASTVRHVHGHRTAVRLPTHKRLRGGRYELTLATKDRHGRMEYKQAQIALQ